MKKLFSLSVSALALGFLTLGSAFAAQTPNLDTGTTLNHVPFAASATTDATNASNITSGTLGLARLPAIPVLQVTGLAPVATSGSASDITTGTLGLARLPTIPVVSISGLAGSATTDTTNASNITSGILPGARLSGVAPLLSNSGSDYPNPSAFRSNIGALSNAGDVMTGNLQFNAGGAPTIVDLFTSPPVNGVYQSPNGSAFSIYPQVGGNPFDNVRGPSVIQYTTTADAGYFECGLCVNSHQVTGRAQGDSFTDQAAGTNGWEANHAYSVGQSILGIDLNIYTVTVAGVTAATGSGPTGTDKTTPIVDGTVQWIFRQNISYFGKSTASFWTQVSAGSAGAVWGVYENMIIDPGLSPNFVAEHEIDFQNKGLDCTIGARACYDLFFAGSTVNPILAMIGMQPVPGAGSYSSHIGILMQGDHMVDTAGIDDETSATVGLAFGLFAHPTHAGETILDNSTSPASLHTAGTYSLGAILDTSHSATGISMSGTYSVNVMSSVGFNIDPKGDVHANSVVSATESGSTPSTIAGFDEETNAPIGLAFGVQLATTHATATIVDNSTSPASIHTAGTYSLGAIFDTSHSATGISLNGTYTASAISSNNFQVTPAGNVVAAGFQTGVSPGVSCTGAPTASFVTVGGLVTHC